ncbi:hypothetical protein K432DRAFT_409004 [Lepidopterella palustris CBS 459.81]|uniref:Uncharacterized protein n=1 Tax=Lepidopterella palustris CBS 459.81 TaxID=1314670 RepID=A0A8E2JAL8_9PEZI|nr:hypothetical protein K432DRAFT_409004 [Lepidopterella palustris CBS 459.81]
MPPLSGLPYSNMPSTVTSCDRPTPYPRGVNGDQLQHGVTSYNYTTRPNLALQSTEVRSDNSATPNTPLVRTVKWKPPPSPSKTPSHSFNPYAIFPNAKTILNIVGGLQSICDGWVEFQQTKR